MSAKGTSRRLLPAVLRHRRSSSHSLGEVDPVLRLVGVALCRIELKLHGILYMPFLYHIKHPANLLVGVPSLRESDERSIPLGDIAVLPGEADKCINFKINSIEHASKEVG